MATGTTNPPGSDDPRDLRANAENLDLLITGPALNYPDRLGVSRRSWAGIDASYQAAESQREAAFQDQLANTGYELPSIPYAAGILIERETQLIERMGEFYRAKPGVVPFTTTGTWATDELNLVAVGDAALRQELASSTGSSLVMHNDGLTGSQDTNVHALALESFCVTRFGAVGNYVVGGSGHDDTAAFQAAFTAASVTGNRALRIPAGTYLITGPVTGQPLFLIGEPGATRIVFKNMAGLTAFSFAFTTQYGRVLGAYGIEHIVEGADLDCVYEGPKNSNQYFTYYLRNHFELNYFRGANRVPSKYSFGWDFGASKWLKMADSVGSHIFHNTFQGSYDIQVDPTGQLQDCCIEWDANGAILSARVHDNNFGPIHTGMRVKNRVFMTAHDNDFIGTMDGIVWDGVLLLNEPKISHNNFNSQRDGIRVSGPDSLNFTDNTVRRHRAGWKGATWAWSGFNIEGCSDLKLSRNTVQPDEGDGPFTGDMTAYNLKTCGLGSISDNFVGVGNDFGFTLDDCTGLTLGGTISAQSAPTDILFNLVNSTRATSIGSFALVSTFTGQPLVKDASITDAIQMINRNFDLQSTGNVILDLTRVNAAANEKKARLSKGVTSLAIQYINDAGAAQNAIIFNQSGNAPVSADVRGTLIAQQTQPRTDNTYKLGDASFRWTQLYAATATINTSDATYKTEPERILDVVLDAWEQVEYMQYKFLDAVDAKGSNARVHFGVIAQRVEAAFLRAGLDPFEYGVLCFDAWEELPEVRDEEGNITQEYRPAGCRYGIRYEEAMALESALTRRTMYRIQTQLHDLGPK